MRKLNLQLFANPNVHTTGTSGISPEMQDFYSDLLRDNAKPALVHDQFAQTKNIPKNSGKTIKFRRFNPLPKATTPLTEGVTPDGRSLSMTDLTATLKQYGDYVTLSDVVSLTSVDNILVEAQELLGNQAGETLDWVTREVIHGGTVVRYAGGKNSRGSLTASDQITVKDIKLAVKDLKNNKASKIDGSYVAIVNPDTAYDLMQDPEWVDASKYAGSKQLFDGELGKIAGCRFVETTEAKVFAGAGSGSVDVHSTIVLGDKAYGTTEIDGAGLESIIKPVGSGGSEDPLNQRGTAGWKALKVAERLVEAYMVRIESVASK